MEALITIAMISFSGVCILNTAYFVETGDPCLACKSCYMLTMPKFWNTCFGYGFNQDLECDEKTFCECNMQYCGACCVCQNDDNLYAIF